MADNASPGPGSINIKNFVLRSDRQGFSIPLENLTEEINIYSDIRSPFMTASFMIADATSLFTLYPITGEEYVDIEFNVDDPSFLFPFKKTFRVASITDIVTNKQPRLAMYRLRCYEPEAFNDWSNYVRKSYRNMTISDMVNKIHIDYLKTQTSTTTLKASATEGNRTIVIPSMRPSEAFKFLAREAYTSAYPASNFVFYSTTDGFHFTTYEELIATKKVDDKYSLQEKNYNLFKSRDTGNSGRGSADAPGKPGEWMKITNYKILSHANAEKTIALGGFDNTHYFIDPVNSYYDNKKYTYGADISKFKRIDTNPGGDIIYKDSAFRNMSGQSHHRFTVTNFSHDRENEDKKHEFLHLQVASMALMENVVLECTVPGDCTRMVGDVIRINFPEFSAFDETIDKNNIFLSGDYLVTSVRHTFNPDNTGYVTIMQCMKNSYAQAPEYGDILAGRSTNTYQADTEEQTATPSYPSATEDRR